MSDAQSPGSDQQHDHDVSGYIRGQSIVEYVSAGLAIGSAGLSEAVMLPIRRVMQKRLNMLEEILIAQLRSGLIDPNDVIEEDRLASFVLRVRRAALEGVAQRKITIIARYFFRHATTASYQEDKMAEYAAITEQLTDDDMRCLAAVQGGRIAGLLKQDIDPQTKRSRFEIPYDMDTRGAFENRRDFRHAVLALIRFGFIDVSSVWGGMAIHVTPRFLAYLDELELKDWAA